MEENKSCALESAKTSLTDVEIEALAIEIRRAAGASDEAVISVVDVVVHWMGAGSVDVVDRMVGRASLVVVNGTPRIMAKRGAADLRFAVAHELGHWALRYLVRIALDHVTEERAANTFAAALLAPAVLVHRAYAFFGENIGVAADRLHLSQTSLALRLGEVRGDPRAVVTRSGHVFTRNANATLTRERAVDAVRGRAPRGLAKARLRGGIDEGRVALRAV